MKNSDNSDRVEPESNLSASVGKQSMSLLSKEVASSVTIQKEHIKTYLMNAPFSSTLALLTYRIQCNVSFLYPFLSSLSVVSCEGFSEK